MSMNGQKMKINGRNLNVLVEGEGEPVMLLHGFPDSNYLQLRVNTKLYQGEVSGDFTGLMQFW